MRRIDPSTHLVTIIVVGLLLLGLATTTCGCSAARTGSVTADDVRQAVQSGFAPIAASIESVKVSAAGVNARDVIVGTGAGAAGLTMAALYAILSHRREMVRLKRNGSGGH